jgi:hypothetical protein
MSTDISTCQFAIINKKTSALFNVPLTRINLVSPYPLYDAYQLNMRRKAEILQYANNQTSTKTNNLTKKQKWSQMVTQTSIQRSITNCRKKTVHEQLTLPTWTTSSDIPGKPIQLTLDPTIPLYKYLGISQRSYSILPDSTNSFQFFVSLETMSSSSSVLVGTIVFTRNTESYSYFETPSLSIPMTMNLHGFLKQNTSISCSLDHYMVTTMTHEIVYIQSHPIHEFSTYVYTSNTDDLVTDISMNISLGILTLPSFTIHSAPNMVYQIYAKFHILPEIDTEYPLTILLGPTQ